MSRRVRFESRQLIIAQPEEIDEIVRACPVMINGESTERIECAGYGNVRNIDEARIRGGVLLVIGEGMCLKTPKIRNIPRG